MSVYDDVDWIDVGTTDAVSSYDNLSFRLICTMVHTDKASFSPHSETHPMYDSYSSSHVNSQLTIVD